MGFNESATSNIIFLAHGSPDPRSAECMEEFASVVSDQIGIPVHSAYLDHNFPTLQEISERIQDPHALVMPMLLSNAFHARFDLPKAAKSAGLQNVMPPIGHPTQVLQELLVRAQEPAIVVSVGTSNVCAQAVFEVAVQSASWQCGISADHAYVTGKKDLIKNKLDDYANSGGKTVIPWFLADGKLMDQIRVEADMRDLRVEGNGICREAIFVSHVVQKLKLVCSLN